MSVFILTYVDEDDVGYTERHKISSKEAIELELRRMHGDGMYDVSGPYEGDSYDTTKYVVEAVFFDVTFNSSEFEGAFDVFGVRPEVVEDTHRMTAEGVALMARRSPNAPTHCRSDAFYQAARMDSWEEANKHLWLHAPKFMFMYAEQAATNFQRFAYNKV